MHSQQFRGWRNRVRVQERRKSNGMWSRGGGGGGEWLVGGDWGDSIGLSFEVLVGRVRGDVGRNGFSCGCKRRAASPDAGAAHIAANRACSETMGSARLVHWKCALRPDKGGVKSSDQLLHNRASDGYGTFGCGHKECSLF